MSDEEYDFSEPWPMFADEEKPWTDLERLLRLNEKMDTQKEMGDALGTTPSTISYWLNKARSDPNVYLEDGTGIECEKCEGETPGPNVICDECLDDLRARDSAENYTDYRNHLQEIHS